jgi:hypothetical protein
MEEYSQSSSENSTDLQADNIRQNPEYHYFPVIKMASQGSQSSQDLKDENVEPGNDQKLAGTLTRLAAKFAKQAVMNDAQKAKELYDAKFVPWITKMVETGKLKPGQGTDVALADMGVPQDETVSADVWEQLRVQAKKGGVDVAKHTWDEYRQEFSARVSFQPTTKDWSS